MWKFFVSYIVNIIIFLLKKDQKITICILDKIQTALLCEVCRKHFYKKDNFGATLSKFMTIYESISVRQKAFKNNFSGVIF